MVNVGDKVFIAPVDGRKENIAVITGPVGTGGPAGKDMGMNSYWTGLVANIAYFSNLERSYVLEPPATTGNICIIEEILQTEEFIGLEESRTLPYRSFNVRGMIKTCARASGVYQYNLGLSIGLFTSEHTKGEVIPGTSPPDLADCLFSADAYGYDNGSYKCRCADEGLDYGYEGYDAPSFTDKTLYLQVMVWSRVYWGSGDRPSNCTAYIKDIRAGGTVYYDKAIHIQDSGTSTTVTETVITDTSQSWSLHEWEGKTVEISSGSAFGVQALVTASAVTSITCADATFVTDGMLVGDTFDIDG